MSTLYVTHPCFLKHDTGFGHPERADRLRAIEKVLEHEAFKVLDRHEAPMGTRETIERAHPARHVDRVFKLAPSAGSVRVDADTVMSEGTLDAAMHAVGAAVFAVDQVMTGKHSNAFAAVRPPGHHAEADRAMGFCFFSNAAVAAHHARAVHGAERVAVVDFDVHHGNGTQDIFWADKNLFYGSTHQMPLFPGTGAANETGVGNIYNAPLYSGCDGADFKQAMETRILPALHDFAPDLIIISAGFDAHRDDPLASLELTEQDFSWITGKLCEVAHKHCGGRVVSLLEGGYDLGSLARSVAVHVYDLMQSGS